MSGLAREKRPRNGKDIKGIIIAKIRKNLRIG